MKNKLKIYQIGTKVKLKNKLEATITACKIRFNNCIEYELTYWLDGTLKVTWIESELMPTQVYQQITIGFESLCEE